MLRVSFVTYECVSKCVRMCVCAYVRECVYVHTYVCVLTCVACDYFEHIVLFYTEYYLYTYLFRLRNEFR